MVIEHYHHQAIITNADPLSDVPCHYYYRFWSVRHKCSQMRCSTQNQEVWESKHPRPYATSR